jgi:hypothetical protein
MREKMEILHADIEVREQTIKISSFLNNVLFLIGHRNQKTALGPEN